MSAPGRQRASRVGADARRARGVAMLLGGERHAAIAKSCKVSKRQVERWAALPEVREKLKATAAEAERTAADVLVGASRKAAEALVQVIDDPEASPADRTRAALAVLDRTGHAATSKSELTGKDGAPVSHEMTVTIARDEALSIARRKGE